MIGTDIIIEDKLKELFATLPVITWNNPATTLDETFPVNFEVGDENDFNEYLRQEDAPFPLIWLDTGWDEDNDGDGLNCDLVFILPILTNASGMFNQERLDLSFKNVLTPLLTNMIKAFQRASNLILLDNKYTAKKFYNYGEVDRIGKEKQKYTSPVEAYKLTVDIKFLDSCLKTINYG